MATSALLLATQAMAAQHFRCEMKPPCPDTGVCTSNTTTISFKIDPNQFADPVDPNEPPRNKITIVTLDADSFKAEPILMDSGIRGFWTDSDAGEHLMTIQPDRTATYTSSITNTRLTGNCEAYK